MSLYLRSLRLVKPALVRRSSLLLSNGFSTSLQQNPPCSILGAIPCLPFEYFYHNRLATLVILNAHVPDKSSIVRLQKKVPVDLVYNTDLVLTIGASYGWVASLMEDGILRLQDDLNPVASDTDPKRIPLPPLVTLPHCQTQIITNVSMSSSSPDDDEDCVVAVKFLGPQLSFCKPAAQGKPEWTNLKIENPCFYSSRVMYSKKDNMFRIPGSGGDLIASFEPNGKLELQSLRFQNLPTPIPELMDSCCIIPHLVESASTGETFLVKQYRKTYEMVQGVAKMRTQFLMVFKLDDEGNAVYTQDVGDLTMFLSKSEPFCVPSTSFPGLLSNKVYILDFDEFTMFNIVDGSPFVSSNGITLSPYYIPPQNKVDYLQLTGDIYHPDFLASRK